MREALSTTLSSLPPHFHVERAELRQLLLDHGILHRSPTQPVLSRDGISAPWMLDSLAVTLVPRGAELAGRCLLELLKRFDGRQLATYGLTGVPILESCILQSGGRYHGLLVRKQRKKHGALKLIEGPVDPTEPIILVDDSISSGTSMLEACQRLEETGLRVEGGVCLVRFGWYDGYALLQGRGYHVEAVYDAWEDLMPRMGIEPEHDRNPSKRFPELQWSSRHAPEGLHPAHLARLVILEYLASRRVLRPPEQLDADYDASGGAWVSLRSREDIHLRHARDGFWHFPGEAAWTTAESVARAALKTASHLPVSRKGERLVESSSIAVTFFSALEKCSVGQLDNDRYGIVVCSQERPSWMGGALPRMPGISNEWEQFQHARVRNGTLLSFEPYVLYRHEVVKAVEPGAVWQPTGVPEAEGLPWYDDHAICGQVALRARDVVVSHLLGHKEAIPALADGLLPDDLDSLCVSIHMNGDVRGCTRSGIKRLDQDLRKLSLAALEDARLAEVAVPDDPNRVAVSVALLYHPLDLGVCSPREVALHLRHGQQALLVQQGRRAGLLLPFVAVTHNLDRSGFIRETIKNSGIPRPPYHWHLFDCSTWLADEDSVRRLGGGSPAAVTLARSSSLEERLRRLAKLYQSYLIRHQRDDGSLFLRYEPFRNRLYYGVDAPKLAHAAWVLARAHKQLGGRALQQASSKIIAYHLSALRKGAQGCWLEEDDDHPPSVAEVSFLLLALCQLPGGDPRGTPAVGLSATLWASIDGHGRISTHRPPAESPDAFQDSLPGQALLALGSACEVGLAEEQKDRLSRAFRYYRHRFRHKRAFGQVSWLMQAFSAWWRVRREPQFAALVFEIGDWILEYQQEKTGAFINDHQPDTPGYTTALYLEGLGAAVKLATTLGDQQRHQRYLAAYTRGLLFLDHLVFQPRDASLFSDPEFAVGGVPQSLYRSEVRIDFVQHALSAILELCPGSGPRARRNTGRASRLPRTRWR